MNDRAAAREPVGMLQRLVISSLWFAAFLCLHEIAWAVFGSPRELGVALGVLAASFVYFNPKQLFLSRTAASTRQLTRVGHSGLLVRLGWFRRNAR